MALRQAWRACKLVWQFVAMRRTKQSQDNKSPAPSASETEASSRRKSGKSIKALLKQQKKAQQRPQHEQVPESDFFLNSLKGHGGTVVSVDISPGDTHIMTACTDQVRLHVRRVVPTTHTRVPPPCHVQIRLARRLPLATM